MRRKLTIGIIAMFAWQCGLLAAPEQAPAAAGKPAPSVTLGGSRPLEERLSEVVGDMEGRQTGLLGEQAEFVHWKELKDGYDKAVKQLTRRREDLRARPVEELDPALVPQLEANLELVRELSEAMGLLMETFRAEQADVRAVLEKAKAALEKARVPVAPTRAGEKRPLDEVMRFLDELRSAELAMSLLKARRAGLLEELAEKEQEKAEERALRDLPDFGGDPALRKETLDLRDQYTRLELDLRAQRETLRRHVVGAINVQLQSVRLEVFAHEDGLARLEAGRDQVLGSLQVSEEDVTAAGERAGQATARLDKEEAPLRKELQDLRLIQPRDGVEGTFTPFREWQARTMLLQHRLYVLELERQTEEFRAATVASLARLTHGKGPGRGFRRQHAYLLDADKQENARAELERRRVAWRQSYSQAASENPSGGEEKRAASVVGLYRGILDTYDLIAVQKWQVACLSQVANHFLDRWEAAQRGPLWYAWRLVVTVLLFLLALLASMVVGRATLRPVRARAGMASWGRVGLFAAYLLAVLGAWGALALVDLHYVWGAVVGLKGLTSLLHTTLFMVGETEVNLLSIASLLGVLGLTLVVNRAVGLYLERQIFAFFAWDLGVRHAVLAVVKYVILFAGLVIGFEMVGIGGSALALFAGVVGIGIGFGLQNIASNFISGLIILFERPVKKGDFVDAGGLEGEVTEIRARATTITTRDNVAVIVPNSEFVSAKVVNWSHGSSLSRLHVKLGVAYGSDLHLVQRLLLEVAAAHPAVVAKPAPKVEFQAFGASSLDLDLEVWTNEVRSKAGTVSDLNYAIDAAFRAHGVEVPFPQQDVHIRSDERPTHE
jgi:small-conductance mechanosensitive channel